MRQKEVYFLNDSKEKLSCIMHLPAKTHAEHSSSGHRKGETRKAVIVCHGFGSNKNALWIPKLCNALAKEGYNAIRFDFSGNGDSEGKFEDADCEKEKQDLNSAIKFLSKKYPLIATIGHSMGGTVVLMNAAEQQKIKAAIAIAAAIHTKKVEQRLLTPKEKQELHKKGKVNVHIGGKHYTLKKNFFTAFEKQKVLKNVHKIKTPILLIHGSDDHTIPLEESKSAKKELPALKLTVIEGGNHTLMKGKSANILIETITKWLKQNF